MLPRLNEMEKDLLLRRKSAEKEGWLGEVDGIDKTLTFLHAKRDEAQRAQRRPVNLGIPTALPQPRSHRTGRARGSEDR